MISSNPADRAFELLNGFRASALVRTAAQLRIPDLLADGPRTAAELASQTGMLEDPLRRVLRSLCALGVFEEVGGGRFGLTAIGQQFRDLPGSQRTAAIMLPVESAAAFQELTYTLETGRPAYEKVHGESRWQHISGDAGLADAFQRAMISSSELAGPAVARAFDFPDGGTVVDVGGGRGALVAEILIANPGLRGVVLDLPAALNGAEEYLAARGVAERCRLVAGDFFQAVPEGGVAYLLKFILHDWPDEDCRRILATCRKTVPAGAALLLVERVLPERATPAVLRTFMADAQMLTVLGGRERTEAEYGALLDSEGFALRRVEPLVEAMSLLEARSV